MYKNSKKNIIYPLFLAVAVVIGIFIGIFTASHKPSQQQSGGGRLGVKGFADNKLVQTLSLIDRMYVDSVDMDTLTETAIVNLLEELDPHSNYIPAQSYAAVNEALDGEFDGIGVVFNMATDTIIVLNVISGGPSDKAGVRNGDRIMMIGDSLVAGQKINQEDIVKMLRGTRGTKVDLSLKRQGIAELVPVTVTRGKVDVKSLEAAFMIRPGIGFIKLSAFARNSISELNTALANLKAQGMNKLIFDLRGNTGGFLQQAGLIANEFLPARTMIVYTENRFGQRDETYSTGNGKYSDMELAILVDEQSASASEILAGAIQDNDRGIVVGRRTFGKGLVQEQIPFSDGSAIRLTIARYYTPTGRSIQRPYDSGREEYNREFVNRYEHNELFSADSIKFADSLRYTTPGGRIVYGGGGIMPDIFVPLDTAGFTQYYLEVSGRNILYRYTIEYSDRHRDELNSVSNVAELDELLDKDKSLLNDFITYASSKGVKPNYGQIAISREIITAQLRAYIGRNTSLEDTGFYAEIYPIDNIVMKAVETLESGPAIDIQTAEQTE